MTTAREVVDACGKAIVTEIGRRPISYTYKPAFGEMDVTSQSRFTIDVNSMALAVIRALASAGCTEAMERASIWGRPADDPNRENAAIIAGDELRAMLSALADGYEREREGGG